MLNIQYNSMKSSQTDWGVGIIMPTFMTMTLELKEIQAPIPASLASQTQNKNNRNPTLPDHNTSAQTKSHGEHPLTNPPGS